MGSPGWHLEQGPHKWFGRYNTQLYSEFSYAICHGRVFSVVLCEVLVTQLCPTLCDPMDYNVPGSSAHGVLQARILEWVAISSPGDIPDPGIEPTSPVSPALHVDSLLTEPSGLLSK